MLKDFRLKNRKGIQLFEGYHFGRIGEAYLSAAIHDFSKIFYVCGPPPLMD